MKKIGDRVTVIPNVEAAEPLTGTIIHINYAHRHFTVRFAAGWIESFKF